MGMKEDGVSLEKAKDIDTRRRTAHGVSGVGNRIGGLWTWRRRLDGLCREVLNCRGNMDMELEQKTWAMHG